jgi:hypothetical protein
MASEQLFCLRLFFRSMRQVCIVAIAPTIRLPIGTLFSVDQSGKSAADRSPVSKVAIATAAIFLALSHSWQQVA